MLHSGGSATKVKLGHGIAGKICTRNQGSLDAMGLGTSEHRGSFGMFGAVCRTHPLTVERLSFPFRAEDGVGEFARLEWRSAEITRDTR